MLFLNPDSLGEQALNQLATLALQSQFQSAQHLNVQVETNPSLLAQGRLTSLRVEGSGLVLGGSISLQGLQLQLRDIAVQPLKALLGTIELTAPIRGWAWLVLSEADCEAVLNSGRMANPVRCECCADGTLVITLKAVSVSTRPQLCPQRGRATCAVLDQTNALPPEVMTRLERCLNLEPFTLPGLSLHPQQLRVETGRITIQAQACLTHFPQRRSPTRHPSAARPRSRRPAPSAG